MNELHTFTFNLFSEQTYLLDHGDGTATVFDPGMSTVSERNHFEIFCTDLGVTVVNCLLTHAHLDHVMGVAWIADKYGVNPRLHPEDEDVSMVKEGVLFFRKNMKFFWKTNNYFSAFLFVLTQQIPLRWKKQMLW